jgi:hypothetical protein
MTAPVSGRDSARLQPFRPLMRSPRNSSRGKHTAAPERRDPFAGLKLRSFVHLPHRSTPERREAERSDSDNHNLSTFGLVSYPPLTAFNQLKPLQCVGTNVA